MALRDMLTDGLVLRIRLIVYSQLIFFSFFIFIGVAVMKNNFFGECPLYIKQIKSISHYKAPPISNCNYPMAIAIIFQLLYILFRFAVLGLVVFGKLSQEDSAFNRMRDVFYVLTDVAAGILTFIGACILSAGMHANFYSFSDISSAGQTSLNVAQAGAWISSVLWLIVSVVGLLYIVRSGKLPFMQSSGAATSGPAATGVQHVEAPPTYNEASKY
jgi:hypothetical protein